MKQCLLALDAGKEARAKSYSYLNLLQLKKTTQEVKVHVPVNPASLINVQPLDEGLLDGALPAVYRHKTQQKDKPLVIIYTNLSEKVIIISPNQLIAHSSMIF